MFLFTLPKSTRGQVIMAALHVGMLAVALAVAWEKTGPPAEKAFWAILSYFVEIAVGGLVEVTAGIVRAFRGAGADVAE